MKRALSVAMAAALLMVLLPIGSVTAHNSGHQANGPKGKVTICHNPNGAHPVQITVSKASWTLKAHMKHGDFIVTTDKPCVPKPKPATTDLCTFDAATSSYYNGPNNTYTLAATGPIKFSWHPSTGAVVVPGGFWNEQIGGTTYFNNVSAGTVTGAGVVNLSFVRTVPDSHSFGFTGNLSGNVLSGQMDGPYFFTATGTVTCAQATVQNLCTFDAPSFYYNGPNATYPLYATGPIHFSWTTTSGAVTVPGGYWDELLVGQVTPYHNLVTTGTVLGTGAVNLSFHLATPFVDDFTFAGTLASNVLSGNMDGNWFTASGTTTCGQTQSAQHGDNDEDDD